LVEWLKVKKRQQHVSQPRCELCGEIFVFQNIYAVGAPSHLTPLEIIKELMPRILSVFFNILSVGTTFVMWVLCLPLFTNCLVKISWCLISENVENVNNNSQQECLIASFPIIGNFDSFSLAWYNGIMDISVIFAATVVCFEVGQVVYREIEIAEKNRKIKLLEHQLAEHIKVLQKFEDDRRISEAKMFAIADYESLNYEWKLTKRQHELNYIQQQESGIVEVFANEIYMIQKYMIDKKYTALMAEKLGEVSILLPDFKSAAEYYVKLNALLIAELSKLDGNCLDADSRAAASTELIAPNSPNRKTDLHLAVEDAKQKAVVALEKLCQDKLKQKRNVAEENSSTSPPSAVHLPEEKVTNTAATENSGVTTIQFLSSASSKFSSSFTVTDTANHSTVDLGTGNELSRETASIYLNADDAFKNQLSSTNVLGTTDERTVESVSDVDVATNSDTVPVLLSNDTIAAIDGLEKDVGFDTLNNISKAGNGDDYATVTSIVRNDEYFTDDVTKSGTNELSPNFSCMSESESTAAATTDNSSIVDADGGLMTQVANASEVCNIMEVSDLAAKSDTTEGIIAMKDSEAGQDNDVASGSQINAVAFTSAVIDADFSSKLSVADASKVQASGDEANIVILVKSGEIKSSDVNEDNDNSFDTVEHQASGDTSSSSKSDDITDIMNSSSNDDSNLAVDIAVIPNEAIAIEANVAAAPAIELPPALPPAAQPPVQQVAAIPNGNNNGVAGGAVRARGNEHGNMDLSYIHLLGVFLYIFIFMLVLLIVPVFLGRFIFNSYLLSDSFKQMVKDMLMKQFMETDHNLMFVTKFLLFLEGTEEVMHDDNGAMADLMFLKTKAIMEIMIGYSVYLSFMLMACGFYCFKYLPSVDYGFSIVEALSGQIKFLITGINTAIKMMMLLWVYLVATPIILIFLTYKPLVMCLHPKMSSEIDSGDSMQNAAHTAFLYLIAQGIIAHSMVICHELRLLIRKDYLVEVLPQSNQAQNGFFGFSERVAKRTYSNICRRTLINSIFIISGALVTIIIPLRLGHLLCLSRERLVFRLRQVVTDVQIPVEMILSHIFIPFLIEKLQYRKLVNKTLSMILQIGCKYLAMEWVLSPENFPELFPEVENQPNPNNAPLAAIENVVVENHNVAVLDNNEVLNAPINEDFNAPVNADFNAPINEDLNAPINEDLNAPINEDLNVPIIDDLSALNVDINVNEVLADAGSGLEIFDGDNVDTTPVPTADLELVGDELLTQPSGRNPEDVTTVIPPVGTSTSGDLAPSATLPQPGPAQPFTIRDLPTDVRAILLTFFGFFSIAVVSSWLIHLPLKIGRPLLQLLLSADFNNDFFNFPVGLAVCWFLSYILRYIYNDIMVDANLKKLLFVVSKWLGIIAKVVLVGAVWLIVPPMLVGYLIEAFVMIPFRTTIYETPNYPFLQCWAIGLIVLKVWTRCVMTGMFGDIRLRLEFEQIMIRGFAQFDALSALKNVLLPVITALLDFILIPFFFSRMFCMLTTSYLLRTKIVRYSIHTYLLCIVLWKVVCRACTYVASLHNEIRDSRYLIGTKLSNRS